MSSQPPEEAPEGASDSFKSPDFWKNSREAKQIAEQVARAVRRENEVLLERHRAMKPLLSVGDVAKTLGVSKRTVETIIADGQLRPLWVRGQRRFHPDTVDAYLRRQAGRAGR